MRHAMIALAFAVSVPAAAQVAPAGQMAEISAAVVGARSMAERLAPAAVDPGVLSALARRLDESGSAMNQDGGSIAHVLGRNGAPDERGRFRGIAASLIELPAEAVEPKENSQIRDLAVRRYFSHLEAESEDSRTDPETGTGRVDRWRYVLSLDGRLLVVEHSIVPVKPAGRGQVAPVEDEARSYRMSPSDPSVQKRWKGLSRELLTLDKTVEI